MRANSRAENGVFLGSSVYPMHIIAACIIGKNGSFNNFLPSVKVTLWGFCNNTRSSSGLFKMQPAVGIANRGVWVHSNIPHPGEAFAASIWKWRLQVGWNSMHRPPLVKDSATSGCGAFLLLSVCGISVFWDEVTVVGTDSREIMN